MTHNARENALPPKKDVERRHVVAEHCKIMNNIFAFDNEDNEEFAKTEL